MSHWEVCPRTLEEPLLSTTVNSPGGLLYGYSVYTTIRMPLSERWLDVHLQRLKRDARVFGLEWRYADHQIASAIHQAYKPETPVVRLTLLADVDGYGELYGERPLPSRLLLSCRVASHPPKEGLRLHTVQAQRPLPTHKHGAMADIIQCKRHARAEGFDDVLLINQAGHYAECTTANIFFIGDGKLHTPLPERDACLPGITRQQVLEAAQAQGIPVATDPIGPAMLPSFQGAFLTNAAQGVMRAASIDETLLPWPDEAIRLANALAASLCQ